MKIFLLLLLYVSFVFADSQFWQKVTLIENKYYTTEEANQTDEIINKTIDAKYNDFSILISLLKNKPYDISTANDFNINETQKVKLLQKIKTNNQYGYSLAVARDKLKLENLKLKQIIYLYFLKLSSNWVDFKDGDLKKLNKTYIDTIAKIDYSKYYVQYQKMKNNNSKIENDTKEAFKEFNKHYLFFTDMLGYIDDNRQMFEYESLANLLKLGVLIDKINSVELCEKLNLNLRFIHLDMGRIILFLFVISFSSLFSYILYKKIYNFLKFKIFLKENETDDILFENLNKIRKPVAFLIILIGFQLSLDVLVYPNTINEVVSNVFYVIVVLNLVYLFFIFIDNTIFIYLTNKNNDNIRKELVTLLIAIFKIIVFLIGVLLILVQFNINISGILASLGIGGLAVALAAQSTLSNFFGLIKMIVDKSFSIGDWIQTNDVEGTVVKIGFISTKIRTFDNALITVPNSDLANSSIKNWNKRKIGRRIKMNIGVTYNSKQADLENAISQIKNMLQNHHGIVTSKKVNYKEINKFYRQEQKLTSVDDKYGIKTTLLVYLDKFNDSSIDILVYTFTKTTDWAEWLEIKEDVLFKIWKILEANNLEFAFPSQSIYLEK